MKLLDLENLLKGTERQREAFKVLSDLKIFELLGSRSPVLTGAMALGLEDTTTPITLVCSSDNLENFADDLSRHFSSHANFVLRHEMVGGRPAVSARFDVSGFKIEVLAQEASVFTQSAVVLLLTEARLLSFAPGEARDTIRGLIASGSSTEAAFASCFELEGDAENELLKVSRLTDREILGITHRFRFRH